MFHEIRLLILHRHIMQHSGLFFPIRSSPQYIWMLWTHILQSIVLIRQGCLFVLLRAEFVKYLNVMIGTRSKRSSYFPMIKDYVACLFTLIIWDNVMLSKPSLSVWFCNASSWYQSTTRNPTGATYKKMSTMHKELSVISRTSNLSNSSKNRLHDFCTNSYERRLQIFENLTCITIYFCIRSLQTSIQRYDCFPLVLVSIANSRSQMSPEFSLRKAKIW